MTRLVAAMAMAFMLVISCSRDKTQDSGENLMINRISFSDDYKVIKVTATALGNFGEHIVIDSAGSCVSAQQYKLNLAGLRKYDALEVTGLRNLTAERFDSLGLNILILADLTLSQEQIDAERTAVAQIRHSFNPDNVFISFLKSGGEITPTEPLTDFVMENRFIEDGGIGDKYLYRGILTKLRELDKDTGYCADAQNKTFLVMSDGNVWGDDGPFDPNHFEVQSELESYARGDNRNKCFCYSNFSSLDPDGMLGGSENRTIRAMCSRNGSLYQEQFDWFECCDSLEMYFNLMKEEFEISLNVPDGFNFEGMLRTLVIEFRDNVNPSSSLIGSKEFTVGSTFFPVIVNGVTDEVIAIRGAFLLLAILCAVFIIFQFIVPVFRYKRFLRENVASYSGPNMCINGRSVADTCYLCKAPFKKGEKLVAKCEHTMHKECWDENGYHCPEFGSRCKTGSHYYNAGNLYDFNNAPYYAKWVIGAIIATIICWICFYYFSDEIVAESLWKYIVKTYKLNPGTPEFDSMFGWFNSYTAYLPLLSVCLSIPLVALLSFFVERSRVWWKKIINILLRTVSAAVCGYFLFKLNSIFSLTVDNLLLANVFEFVIWLLFVFIMALSLTIGTSATFYQRKFLFLLPLSVLVSFLISFVNTHFSFDYRIIFSLHFLLFAVIISICVAHVAPRSYRYVLHTEGCIKTTDIALYKWFRSNPDMVVTIGKSVDCSIQLSWDIQGDVASKNAEIFMKKGKFYLKAVEDGVNIAGKRKLKSGETVRLYHQTTFRIGTTNFTYQETDMEKGKKYYKPSSLRGL